MYLLSPLLYFFIVLKRDLYDDALAELVNNNANRTLIVSCTKD